VKTIFGVIAAAILAVSCAPNTPQSRIERNPGLFQALPEVEKDLVSRGEIARGMSKDAVWLAWGAPGQRFEGSEGGRITERWDYIGTRPIYHTSFYGAYGYGFVGRHGRRYPYSAYGLAPEVSYVPFRSASVWFVNERVDRWDRLR